MKNVYVYVLEKDDDVTFVNLIISVSSLLLTKPKYEIILLYTFNIPDYILDIVSKYFHKTIKTEVISKRKQKNNSSIYVDNSYTRFQVFTLTDYSKIIYLNNNLLIRQNIDDIFEKDNYYATKLFLNRNTISADIFLIRPNIKDYQKLRKKIRFYNLDKKYELENIFTNLFQWNILNYYYNIQTRQYHHYKNLDVSKIKVINYNGEGKNNLDIYKDSLFELIQNYYKKQNIDLLKLRENRLMNLEEYIKQKYPKLHTYELTQKQLQKLNKKLNQKVYENLTYKKIYNLLSKNGIKLYLYGGSIRDLFNSSKINDIDTLYLNSENDIRKILTEHNIPFFQSKNYPKFFKIGEDENDLELSHADSFFRDSLNSSASMLLYDIKKNLVYDLSGYGIHDALKKIYRKPPYVSYKKWLSNYALINRIYKFSKRGYQIPKENRIQVYNYIYNNEHNYYFWFNIKNKIEDKDDFYKYIGNDVDTLDLDYNGEQFVSFLKHKLDNLREYKLKN